MAPVTRSKNSKTSGDATMTPVSKVKATATTTATDATMKRKAVDDASPVAPKKTRAVKEAQVKTPTISKNGLLPPKKTKEAKSKQSKEVEVEVEGQVIIDEKLEPSIADDDDPFSDDEDSEAKALARVIDTDDEDAGADNGNGALFEPGQDVGKAPKPSKIPKQGSPKPNGETGVIYVGRVPHGFYEHEMRQYFSQFGQILRLRLSRNKRTGASRHFAFIEFEDAAVAEVVQKTMDNYLLFGHILKCKLVPNSQIHDNLWKGANRRFKKFPRNKIEGNLLKKPLAESAWTERISREEKRRSSRAQKLLDMGYEFEASKLKQATDVSKGDVAALEGNDDASEAIDAPPAETAAAGEVANGDLSVKKPSKNKQDGPKATSKKTKKSSKAKKVKA